MLRQPWRMPFFTTIAHGACWRIDGDAIGNKQLIPKGMPWVGASRAQGQCAKPWRCHAAAFLPAWHELQREQGKACATRKKHEGGTRATTCALEWSRKCNNCRRASRAGLMSTHAAFVTCGQQLRFPLPFPFRQQTVACSGEVSLRCHVRIIFLYRIPVSHPTVTQPLRYP